MANRRDSDGSSAQILAQHRRFLSAVLDLGEVAHSTTDDEAFYQQLLERAVDVVPGAEGGSILLAVPHAPSFRFAAAVGYNLIELQEYDLNRNHFFRDDSNLRGEIVREFEIDEESVEKAEWRERAGRLSEILSNVSAPVVMNDQIVAFLSLDNFSDHDAMTDASAEMTTVMARVISNLLMRRRMEGEQLRRAAELHRRATTDELTRVPNRSHLLDALGGYLEGNNSPAVLFCDLDNFKLINDSLGHTTGDALISQTAERLTRLWRNQDVLVGRLGGDEFLIVFRNATEAEAVNAAEKTLAALQAPFSVDRSVFHVRASIGVLVTAGSSPGLTADCVLQQSDTALYEAKARGGNQYLLFDQAMSDAVARRLSVEQQLRVALQRGGEIEAHYQPIVELPCQTLVGVEALIRWRTSSGALVPPGEFLDVADDAGLLGDLGKIMMQAATNMGAELARHGVDLYVSINVSAQELLNVGLVDDLLGMIRQSGVRPEMVLVEITESSVLKPESVLPTLRGLRAAGVRVALDDFGTGYSSLAHLRTLPIDTVKIDRSFVNDLVVDERTRAMTKSLIELCKAIGLHVILEGVETLEQANAVESLGGRFAQGYLYHRPMTASALRDLVSSRAGSTTGRLTTDAEGPIDSSV